MNSVKDAVPNVGHYRSLSPSSLPVQRMCSPAVSLAGTMRRSSLTVIRETLVPSRAQA